MMAVMPRPVKKPGRYTAGHFTEQALQLAARAALQGLPHQVHAEQKKTQPADHRQYIENIHTRFSPFNILLHV